MAKPHSQDATSRKNATGRRIFVKGSFVLGIDDVPFWALRNPGISLSRSEKGATKAVVKTPGCLRVANPGDRIAIDKDGGLHVFSHPPLDAA